VAGDGYNDVGAARTAHIGSGVIGGAWDLSELDSRISETGAGASLELVMKLASDWPTWAVLVTSGYLSDSRTLHVAWTHPDVAGLGAINLATWSAMISAVVPANGRITWDLYQNPKGTVTPGDVARATEPGYTPPSNVDYTGPEFKMPDVKLDVPALPLIVAGILLLLIVR
jgi:hypothetical protein